MKKMDIYEYRNAILQILIKIDKICRDNDIKYMLGYGTLLGAVRHNGFIPWDDDADIVMMRADYNKLMELIENNKEDLGLNFISIENYSDTIYPYGKICDTSTVLFEEGFKTVAGLGAFVDVFPWDYIPDDSVLQEKNRKKYFNLVRLITHSSKVGMPRGECSLELVKRRVAYISSKCFNTKGLVEYANRKFSEFNKHRTNFVGLPWEVPYPVRVLEELCEIEFEGYMFYAPAGYDELLTIKYGDYMKLPPESERVNKHSFECFYRK